MKKIIFAIMVGLVCNNISVSNAEEIDNIEITKITKVDIVDGNKKIIQDGVGVITGAVIGYGAAHYATNYGTLGKSLISIGTGAAGMYVANKYGTENTVESVKIDYTEKSTIKTITLKGNVSTYHTGQAILIIDDKGNQSIHQNTVEKIS